MAPSLKELTAKAQALQAAGRIDEAIAAHQAIAKRAPANGAVLHNLAATLGDADRNAEAVAAAKKAFATGLDAPETWLVMGRALIGLGKFDKAERALREVIRRRPADAAAHRELAQLIWMRSSDREAALIVLNEAIERHPNLFDLAVVRAHVFGQTGEPIEEYREISRLLKAAPHLAPLALAASNAALAAGEYEAALDHARRALKSMPGEAPAIAALCRALLAAGEALEASRVAADMHRRLPLDQSAIAMLATAWRLLGDDRYHDLYDYERFIFRSPLDAPAGWSGLDGYLADLAAALDRHHRYATHPFGQSVRHGSQLPSILSIDEPALKAFAEAAAGPIKNACASLSAGGDPLRRRNTGEAGIITVWSIRLPASGFHVDHVHPQGWLSSACHIRLPAAPEGGDPRAGWLKFGEPGIATTPALSAERFVEPETGVMVLFPSYMWHGTVPFEGKTTRLTIAADIAPKPRN